MVQRGADQGWIGLSDWSGTVRATETGAELRAATLFAEFRPPVEGAQVLLDRRSADGAHAFSILHDTAAGLSVLHRNAGPLARHSLPGPLPMGQGPARLCFGWDVGLDRWQIEFRLLGADAASPPLRAQGRGALPLDCQLLADLCLGRGTERHDGLLWFGVTRSADLQASQVWVGPRTLIPTPQGPLPAEALRPGDPVLTRSGTVPILSIDRQVQPGRGSFHPVLLRAPWYGREDLLVAADQLIALDGPEVEYLFGEEEVLVPARLLIDGQCALAEGRRPVVSGVGLHLGAAELIDIPGCTLCSQAPPGTRLPLRLLDRFEAIPLLAQLGRLPQRAAG